MSLLAWPLQHNQIRRDIRNNAFGMVRNGGTRAHQGWDLVAVPLTPCYAIADGTIVIRDLQGGYGRALVLEFEHSERIDWRTGVEHAWTFDIERERIMPVSTKRIVCEQPMKD